MIHSPLGRVGNYPMKIGSILNFEEWTRTANSSSTNLRKAEIFISIRSKVMSKILTVFCRVFCQFYITQYILQIIITDVFDNDRSIDNAFLTIEQLFFSKNTIGSHCMI